MIITDIFRYLVLILMHIRKPLFYCRITLDLIESHLLALDLNIAIQFPRILYFGISYDFASLHFIWLYIIKMCFIGIYSSPLFHQNVFDSSKCTSLPFIHRNVFASSKSMYLLRHNKFPHL